MSLRRKKMTELESLQQLFKDVKDTDFIIKRMLEYKSVFQVCENCTSNYLDYDGVMMKENYCHLNEFCVSDDFGCNRFERKEDV
jgi:hypothetical protein